MMMAASSATSSPLPRPREQSTRQEEESTTSWNGNKMGFGDDWGKNMVEESRKLYRKLYSVRAEDEILQEELAHLQQSFQKFPKRTGETRQLLIEKWKAYEIKRRLDNGESIVTGLQEAYMLRLMMTPTAHPNETRPALECLRGERKDSREDTEYSAKSGLEYKEKIVDSMRQRRMTPTPISQASQKTEKRLFRRGLRRAKDEIPFDVEEEGRTGCSACTAAERGGDTSSRGLREQLSLEHKTFTEPHSQSATFSSKSKQKTPRRCQMKDDRTVRFRKKKSPSNKKKRGAKGLSQDYFWNL